MKHVDVTLCLEQVRLTKAVANLARYSFQAVASKLPSNTFHGWYEPNTQRRPQLELSQGCQYENVYCNNWAVFSSRRTLDKLKGVRTKTSRQEKLAGSKNDSHLVTRSKTKGKFSLQLFDIKEQGARYGNIILKRDLETIPWDNKTRWVLKQ